MLMYMLFHVTGSTIIHFISPLQLGMLPGNGFGPILVIVLSDRLFFSHCSLTVCQFAARGDMEWFVVVGTARDLILNPRSCSGGCLLLYRLSLDGSTMEFVHMVRVHDRVLNNINHWI